MLLLGPVEIICILCIILLLYTLYRNIIYTQRLIYFESYFYTWFVCILCFYGFRYVTRVYSFKKPWFLSATYYKMKKWLVRFIHGLQATQFSVSGWRTKYSPCRFVFNELTVLPSHFTFKRTQPLDRYIYNEWIKCLKMKFFWFLLSYSFMAWKSAHVL